MRFFLIFSNEAAIFLKLHFGYFLKLYFLKEII